MPETYEMIVAAIQESNLTTPEPVFLPPAVTVSKNGNYNDRNMIRTTKKGRPRVSRYVRTICFVLHIWILMLFKILTRLFN